MNKISFDPEIIGEALLQEAPAGLVEVSIFNRGELIMLAATLMARGVSVDYDLDHLKLIIYRDEDHLPDPHFASGYPMAG